MKCICLKTLGYLALTLTVLPTLAAQNGPIISEFMAANARTWADEDGDFSDWIEIYNPTAGAINLAGYFLTDDPARLDKWAFPSVTLEPGSFLVVFASGKNRTDISMPPHTNLHASFQLDAAGEFLALVNPDGVTFATAFTPAYPPQKEDVSFGTAQAVVTTTLLGNSAPSILVPTSAGELPADWNAPAFVPGAGWVTDTAPPAIGFDTNRVTGAPANVAPGGTTAQSTVNGSYTANLAVNGNLGDFTHTLSTDSSPFWQVTLTNQTSIHSIILYNRTSCCGSRLRDITIEVLSTNQAGFVTNYTSFLLNPENAGYTYPNGPGVITNDLVAITGGPVLGQIVRVRRTPDPDLSGTAGQGNADEATVLSLGEVVVNATAASGLRPYFHTDVQELMWNRNASAFVRLPFAASGTPDSLALRVRYDDGFVAYLNGVEVARRNVPAVLGWDSSATADRNLGSAIAEERINVSAGLPHLLVGSNLLAIQVLNAAASNPDLLFQAELEASQVTVTTNVFLVDPTPGSFNNTASYLDEVGDTHFSVDRGFKDAPFSLVLSCDTPDTTIYYSFNGDEPGPAKGFLYSGPISITNTTVLRVRAFKEGWKASGVDTATYIFLNDVIYQAADWPTTGRPPPNFPASWGRNRVDYGMDPNVVTNYTLAQWREALTQIPTMSIVTEMGNLFDPAIGIYANADGHGEAWERPSSIELLDPTNAVHGRFQEPCGLRIRGGYSRNSSFIKHSFRVFFRRDYGTPKLRYPLFEDEGANEFDTFDLRTSQNYAWPRGESPTHDTMVREVFCRESLGAMGQPYRRSRYYHLYLNGQYWGLYETDERPEASYGETYFGGAKEDYDVVKCANHVGAFVTEVTDGNFTAWSNLWTMGLVLLTNASDANYFRLLGCNPDGTRNPVLPVMVDVDNLIDYMLGIFYAGDGDATLSAFLSNTRPNNWFGMKNRANPDMGFRFFNSDCEHTLGAPSWQADRTGPWKDVAGSNVRNFTYSNPQYLHEECMLNLEYRLRFADHVHRHFFNNGVLTPAAGTNRFLRRAAMITKAIRAYSARWGDGAPTEPPYGESHWTNMINTIVATWFPNRTATVLQQLKTDALYPAVSAPAFSPHGGEITNGFPLAMSHTNTSGVIYYTLDGTDPRVIGGSIRSNALLYAAPVLLDDNVRVKARVLSSGNWSALNEADFAVPGTVPLRITELMYHPAAPSAEEIAAGFTDADLFEYVELHNLGPRAINLAGISFVNGIAFTFSAGVLPAGERLLLVKNAAAFALRYGALANVAGAYSGQLDNAGEPLRLQDARGRVIHDFSYEDGWYPITDGFGFSLSIIDDTAPVATWAVASSWRPSGLIGGSPGAPNPVPPLFPEVVINELLSRPAPPDKVAVELANLSASPADVSGWWLSDDFRAPTKFRLPANTVIPVGGFVVFTEEDFNAPAQGVNAFTFSPSGGEARLFSADTNGALTGYYQGWDFGAADEGVSFGRHVVSTGADHFVAQRASTLGTTNVGPRIGPVVITEIMYRPPDLDSGDNSLDEFVEILNLSTNSVPLFDTTVPTNSTWKVTGGIDFVFPTNVTLAAGEYLLLVNFDPATNGAQLAEFTARYGVPPGVQIFGPYQGKLDNSGEDVELKKPTLFDTGLSGFVMADKVSYHDAAPWPPGADGYGLSLQRPDPAAYGNDPAHWIAAPPNAAGATPSGGTPPAITQQPDSYVLAQGRSVTLSVAATGASPLGYQWRLNGVNLGSATNAQLELPFLLPAQSGLYEVLVYNQAGSAVSEPATLQVVPPPSIVSHPRDVAVRPGSNVVFAIQVSNPRPVTYQWLFKGAPIVDATNSTLSLTNVQLAQDGPYTVRASDEYGAVASQPARLTILIDPLIVQQPIGVSVPQGSTVTLSIAVTNTATLPVSYRWRRTGATVTNLILYQYTSFFVITNVQGSINYSVQVTNLAKIMPVTPNIPVVALADWDRDGLPDVWEVANGFNTNDASDAVLDTDGDTMLNWQEYLAGTEHTNALSYLKVESIQGEAGAVRLEFFAVSNHTYTVQYQPSLNEGAWFNLVNVLARTTNRVEAITDSDPGAASRYYRLVTPAQP